VLAIGCAIVCTGLLCIEKIHEEIFSYIILGTVGAYIAGNTYEKVKAGENEQAD